MKIKRKLDGWVIHEKLVRGRDWHGWAWKEGDEIFGDTFVQQEDYPELIHSLGKWVRVKFVEVK